MTRSEPIGFLVWCPEHGPPTVVHGSFLSAFAEAERLKRLHPTKRFVVMSPVEDMSGVGYARGWDRGRAEGVKQAHREVIDAEAARDRLADENHDLKREAALFAPFKANADAFQAIVADCQCWLDGFNASHIGKDSWERPHVPTRERLLDLNIALQAVLSAQRTSDPLDDEIPF